MKTIIVTIAAALLSLNAAAYNPGIDPDEYCVTKKNGKTVVEYKGKTITKDVTLADGSKIKANGTIVSASGERVKLKDGECINENNISDVIKSHKEKDEGLFDREKSDKNKEGEDNWDRSKDFDRSDSDKDMDNKHENRNKDMDVTDPDRNKDLNKGTGSDNDFDMKHPETKDSLKLKKSFK